jgi:hypothetical protein
LVADAAEPGDPHLSGVLLYRIIKADIVRDLDRVEGLEAQEGVIADPADVVVSAGIVVTGADELATILTVDGDRICGTDEPG